MCVFLCIFSVIVLAHASYLNQMSFRGRGGGGFRGRGGRGRNFKIFYYIFMLIEFDSMIFIT